MDVCARQPLAHSRKEPMKVLGLGLPRTGTTSLCAALRFLGICPYHYSEIPKNLHDRHYQLRLEAVQAKYDHTGRRWNGREDFDRVLWNYDAVSDDPCCLFTDQLVAAYPEAKIILTTRTNASIWLSSMEGFILKILQWRYAYYLLGFFDRESTKPSIELLQCTTSVLSGGRCPTSHAGKMAMLDYYEQQISHVKMAASKSNRPFLEFRPEIGWKPLCDFLGLPVPMVKYPHMNTSYDAMKGERREDRGRWKVVAYRMVVPVILTVVISMYTWSQYC